MSIFSLKKLEKVKKASDKKKVKPNDMDFTRKIRDLSLLKIFNK